MLVADTRFVVFDPSLPYDERQAWNRGCPPGYFAEFVGLGEPMSTPLNGTTAVRCRLIEGTTADDIVRDTGVTRQEAEAVLTGAVRDTWKQLREGGAGVLGALGPVVTLALLALLGVSLARIIRG